MERLTVDAYFKLPESSRPMELIHGVVREPPSPNYGHQSVVTRLAALLDTHVRERRIGEICVSPIDVVLDGQTALVVQPDVVFVGCDRLHLIRDRIWGAPDLVVEVLSRGTAHRDRVTKLGWYSQYGVRECWLVEPRSRTVEVCGLSTIAPPVHRVYSGDAVIASAVLDAWKVPALVVFT